MNCPAPADLVEHTFGDGASAAGRRIAPHLEECASCGADARALQEAAILLRETWAPWVTGAVPREARAEHESRAFEDVASPVKCLSEAELAAAADGTAAAEPDTRGRWLAHMAECDSCRGRLAALQRLLHDPAIARERARVEGPSAHASPLRFRHPYVAAAAVLAVAVVGGALLRPEAPSSPLSGDESPLRENALMTTVAPRILGPVGPAAAADSLVWSSVPHADRYRVRVFERDGTLAWDAHTSDTTLAIPPHLIGTDSHAYLWKVEARTGWDRWVSSEWQELSIGSGTPPR